MNAKNNSLKASYAQKTIYKRPLVLSNKELRDTYLKSLLLITVTASLLLFTIFIKEYVYLQRDVAFIQSPNGAIECLDFYSKNGSKGNYCEK